MSAQSITPKHQANSEGTFDSVCTVCCKTIATRDSEDDLIRDEINHPCIRSAINNFMGLALSA